MEYIKKLKLVLTQAIRYINYTNLLKQKRKEAVSYLRNSLFPFLITLLILYNLLSPSAMPDFAI